MSHTTLLDLSRWQWALTAAFHITFPAVTVGTSVFLIVCAGICLLALLFTVVAVLETKGRTLEQIEAYWRRVTSGRATRLPDTQAVGS